MNKQIRKDIERKKWFKRLDNLNLQQTESQQWHCFKKQAKPCSCYACKPLKYSRKNRKKTKEKAYL